ncbi:MAG: MmgE/PrpD family protein [Oscillospiraceae bacterium]|nr:MmgE/PrpD family protein [Oscillospiraceae bacterium]
MNITDQFIETLYTLHGRMLPAEIELEARKCLMDEIGAIIAGAKLQETYLTKYLDCFTGADATVIGLGRKTSMQNAALCNGVSGHSYDFDDGHRFSTVHLGSAVIPAVLAVCEKQNLPMESALRGIVIGYETAIRLGQCMQPGHRARGFHASGTIGTAGAAMGCASALNLDKAQFKTALAAAFTSAGGILNMQEDASTLKPFNIGRAAHDGVTAAYMAYAGFVAPNDPLLGRSGFLAAYCEKYDTTPLTLEADDTFHITGGYHKPYASCRHTHGPVFSVLHCVNDNNLDWREIKQIDIRMYAQGVNGHDHTEVPSAVAGKMSTPYCIALCLKTGKINIDSFTDEALNDPEILALSKKVRVIPDEEMTSWVPKKRAASATVTMNDGKSYFYQADYAPGEPEMPMSIEDFCKKLTELGVAAGKSEAECKTICELILHHTGSTAEFIAKL